MSRRMLVLLGLAFLASGVSALVCQVSWQRILALHTGVGIVSIALIVAAFLLGLGLGSHLGGVLSARLGSRRALQAFALLELGIAGFGAASPTCSTTGSACGLAGSIHRSLSRRRCIS